MMPDTTMIFPGISSQMLKLRRLPFDVVRLRLRMNKALVEPLVLIIGEQQCMGLARFIEPVP